MDNPQVTINTLVSGDADPKTGVFDILYKSVADRLSLEYEKGYMTSNEYTQLLLGALQAVLTESVQYTLSMNKATQEARLLEKQNTVETLNIGLRHQQIQEAKHKVLLAEAQVKHQSAETDYLVIQQDKLLKEIEAITAQITHQTKETDILDDQQRLLVREYETMLIQQDKLEKDIEAIQSQIALSNQQILKIQADVSLSGQKLITERANTDSTVGDVDSLIGKQRTLLQGQADGFIRDAEQKAAKMILDTFMVRASQGDALPTTENNLMDSDVGAFVTKLANGIGIS